MTDQTITLITPVLGTQPFVLIELRDGGDGDDDLRLSIRAGGGINTDHDIASALFMALINMPGNAGPLGELLDRTEDEAQPSDSAADVIGRIRAELGISKES